MAGNRQVDEWHLLGLILEEIENDEIYFAAKWAGDLLRQTFRPTLVDLTLSVMEDMYRLDPSVLYMLQQCRYLHHEKTEGMLPEKTAMIAALKKEKIGGKTIKGAQVWFDSIVCAGKRAPAEAAEKMIRYFTVKGKGVNT